MQIRTLRSQFTVAGSASGAEYNSDISQTDLDNAVPTGGSIQPLALVFDPEDDDITIHKLVFKNTKNDEGAIAILPEGTAVKLVAVNKLTQLSEGGVQCRRLPTAHGARLVVKASNANASPKTITVLWRVDNDPSDAPGQQFLPRGLRGVIPPGYPNPGVGAYKFMKF